MAYHCSVGEAIKIAHDKDLAIVPLSDYVMDETPILVVSNWVLNAVVQVSEVLGLSFEGLEQ